MSLLVTAWHGCHLLQPEGDGHLLLAREDAPRDAQGLAAWLRTVRQGEVLPAERRLIDQADAPVQVLERRLRSLGDWTVRPMPELPMEWAGDGYTPALLHEALLVLAVEEAHGALGGPDLLLVHQVRALDDVVRTMNLLSERLREWYAVHAPEVNTRVKDHGELARLVADTPDPATAAKRVGIETSGLGVEAPQADAALVARFAQGYVEMMELRADLEARLETAVQEIAPCLTEVLSPTVAARIIAQAGGIEKLAYMSAGTVQTLGAENALFRHLREGAAPPKHGILFQHDAVYRAPWWLRGKIARALSGKVTQAASMDAFGGSPEAGTRLRESFEARVKEVRARHPGPPAKKPRRPGARPGPRPPRGPSHRSGKPGGKPGGTGKPGDAGPPGGRQRS